jgi:hypothetical protein
VSLADTNALHNAIMYGKPVAVAKLLASDPNLANCMLYGMAALDVACAQRQIEIVKLLLDAGADPNLARVAGNGDAALHTAAASGDVECIRLLLAHGATVDLANPVGATPLMRAAQAGKLAAVEALLTAGANARETNGMGDGVLRFVVDGAHEPDSPAVAQALLAAGAEISAMHEHYRDALEMADERHAHQLAGILAKAAGRPSTLSAVTECAVCLRREVPRKPARKPPGKKPAAKKKKKRG